MNKDLKILGKKEAEELSNYNGQKAVNFVDFGGNTLEAVKDRGFTLNAADLGKPITDGVNDPGDPGWVPTYSPSAAGKISFALFGGLYQNLSGAAATGGVTVDQLNREILGLNPVSYIDATEERIVVWGIDSAGAGCHIAITGSQLFTSFRYFYKNPTAMKWFSLNMSNVAQAALGMIKSIFDPFRPNLNSKNIRFADYDNPDYFKTNLLYVPLDLAVDNNSSLVYELPNASNTTITMYAGDIVNLGKGLAKANVKGAAQVRSGVPGLRFKK